MVGSGYKGDGLLPSLRFDLDLELRINDLELQLDDLDNRNDKAQTVSGETLPPTPPLRDRSNHRLTRDQGEDGGGGLVWGRVVGTGCGWRGWDDRDRDWKWDWAGRRGRRIGSVGR